MTTSSVRPQYKKFPVNGLPKGGGLWLHFLIEAPTRELALETVLDELKQTNPEFVDWQADYDPAWRAAWRRQEVKVLRYRPLPGGME